jgi:hypothetical protein
MALRELRGGATQWLETFESRPGTELWKHGIGLTAAFKEEAHVYMATANPRYREFLLNSMTELTQNVA